MSQAESQQQQQETVVPNDQLKALIEKYLQYERNAEHRLYIERLVEQNDVPELTRLIGKRLLFGTAGIRGRMGAGFGQMNDLVIIQTSQGLASYLLDSGETEIKKRGVIIGHDARHNSDRFARLAVLAFLQRDIPVYYCDRIVATPLIAFGVKHFNCLAGIMVTASHNPKDDNGYKVYGPNGAQILSPHDRHIQEHIMLAANQQPWPMAWRHELLLVRSDPLLTGAESKQAAAGQQKDLPQPAPKEWEELVFRIHGKLSKSYLAHLDELVVGARGSGGGGSGGGGGNESHRRRDNMKANFGITYTTMHGVGHQFLSRALEGAGFQRCYPVELQMHPDPEFPTVEFPNPEEAGALDLAFDTAKQTKSSLILAVDPDADRCAVALYEPERGLKRALNGNEIGALLGWWLWHCYTSDGALAAQVVARQDCYMISTAVSSKFLQSMARLEGFQFVETLTGFKYMGNLTDELMKGGGGGGAIKRVLFAYEEAIGYMVNSSILDKDGISASLQVAQCAAYLANNYQRTLEQQLDWLYTTYGYHYSSNSYYICSDQATIGRIFHKLQADYPVKFGNLSAPEEGEESEVFYVKRVRDLNNGFDSGTADKKAILPTSSSSFMVTFFVDDNITFTIRTSGTEPKIKYYSEIVADLPPANGKPQPSAANDSDPESAQGAAKEAARNRLHRFLQLAIEQCLQPALNDLKPAH